jgi:hypothetical protein
MRPQYSSRDFCIEKYEMIGNDSFSAMTHRDSDEQKQALLELIDAIDGKIINDCIGEYLTKDAAKKYVMEYGKTDPIRRNRARRARLVSGLANRRRSRRRGSYQARALTRWTGAFDRATTALAAALKCALRPPLPLI